MAVNQYKAFVLTLTICINLTCACNLVPSSYDGTCFELSASPFITYETTEFGQTIEGASVNPDGEMFAVNYGTSESTYQLGQIFPEQQLFYRDSDISSFFNGIRFLNSTTAFIADVENHRVLQLTVGPGNNDSNSSDYCSDMRMLQPNDLALSKTGTVFTSGMNWIDDTGATDGDIWSCLPDGTVTLLELLGRTNGIDLTPDEQHLYVSESYNTAGVPVAQKIWRYNTNVNDGTITNKTLFADFDYIDKTAANDIDGMKTDMLGNLFVTRHGGGHIAIFSADGALLGKIALSFPNPTNLEFGGPNGTTLFIVGECAQEGRGCVDRIEVNTPGRSWSMLQASNNAWRTFQISYYMQIFSLIMPLFFFTVRV